uniref:F-box domain-containing protein n=1 Tax=Kalanchoe fedtschenkoi TaxID=63787 RepID=A0A7N1A0V5_KALFE
MSNKKVWTDRFSNLPDDTVDLILDNLNLEEVIRTRVLSTRWNGCWKRLRKIDFSKDLVEKLIQGREHDLNRVVDSILP